MLICEEWHVSTKLVPILLSGGAGTRLWPVSREAHPKPFMQMADGQSLLQKTFVRAARLDGVDTIMTVTNREYFFKTRDDYDALGKDDPAHSKTFLLEPLGRNTAPAVALSALWLSEQWGPDTVMLVLAADHLIEGDEAFGNAVRIAGELAAAGQLVTFGVTPTAPETGYGYIERGAATKIAGGYDVARFVEKPPLETAQRYVVSGRHFWNSGIFCFTAKTILTELKKHSPRIHEGAQACWTKTKARKHADGTVIEIDQESFAGLPDLSIDYAVMEKSDRVSMVPAGFSWSDIGSWSAVSGLVRPDAAGNSVVGEAVLVDAENTFIRADGRMVAAVGTRNLIIVDTPDALLVADRDRTQDVKKVVEQLKLQKHESYKVHRTVTRPWGTYTVLEEGERFKIKRIVVKPGGILSLQMHHHRSEHWVVVSGIAKVVRDEDTYFVNVNESTFIPAGRKHRVENSGMLDLVMIEVQSGDYLGEDDIVRFEDYYGRS
jgi:mannose-1-phosphate guanylyltransferase/mannose-6-phosphate isomerase